MILYLDTSALVKAVSDEQGTEDAQRMWFSADAKFRSRVTYAEARAALARAHRSGRSNPSEHAVACRELEIHWEEVETVEVTDDLVRFAGDLADRRALRGYDAVHLASALTLGDEVLMATWDRELSDAASEEGLPTLTI